MGTYKIGIGEIIEKLEMALDGLEGDFTEQDLLKSLYVMKHYPYVSDVSKSEYEYKKLKKTNSQN